MAKYRYMFMRTDQELSVSVEADEPLPHIAVGNRLIVSNAHLSQDGGSVLKIRDVEMTLATDESRSVRVVQIVVYVVPTTPL